MKFYAGLDVGGTSGRVKFSAEDKTLIGEYLGEGCAFNTEGYELGREKYRKLMDAALSKYELKSSDCLGICIAASGIDSKEQEMQMRSIFEEIGFAKKRILAVNDCELFYICLKDLCLSRFLEQVLFVMEEMRQEKFFAPADGIMY